MSEVSVVVLALALTLAALIAGVTTYNVRELEYRKHAIEHGCSIDSRETVICAAGDRK